jgi:predicted Rossmann fold flavoprotein
VNIQGADDGADIAIVGAGAAGLMAAIWAGRTEPRSRIVALDGARVIGAKILVAGGGRCNVTHDVVDETAYAGSSRNAIRKVLKRFDVGPTVEFFRGLGVELKREETGKLFPVTDNARTVLGALLGAVRASGVEVRHPWRVGAIRRAGGGFEVEREGGGTLRAARVILATGGMALPRSGSDGQGYSIAKSLGHTVTERVFPALVPLTLPKGHFVCGLSGVAAPASLELRETSGRRLASFTGAVLCTHFGVSGPAVLDISRYCLERAGGASLVVNWLPGLSREGLDGELLRLGARSVGRFLGERLPERLAQALCREARVDAATPGHGLTREQRRAVTGAVCEMPLPVTGDRGFTFAEATAGGVPLSELHLNTMESRVCPGLHLCGEVCDVDGRIGGYNFQWAWASGFVAGCGAAAHA